MKKSVILDILIEGRGYIETMGVPDYDAKSLDICIELEEKLNQEQLELFNRYNNEAAKESLSEVSFYYQKGFKLGLLLGLECLEN